MLYGYAGKIGWVNLTDGNIRIQELEENIARKYLGGKGMGAYLLYHHLKPHTSPLDPKNPLIFVAGPLTGTTFPAVSRGGLITRSPLTGTFLDSYAGGSFGPVLKYAGFDALVIEGKAERPVFVMAEDGIISIQDAQSLWGLSTSDAEKRLSEILGNPEGDKVSMATIGPAGENQVLIANIITERRAFGRGGAGAVMGSKNLKALVLKGRQKVTIADRDAFKAVEKACRKNIAKHPLAGKQGVFPKVGTMMTIEITQETGTLPTRNWQENSFEKIHAIDAEAFTKHIVRPRACFACPIGCSRDSQVVYKGREWSTEGPEYETIYAFGPNCGIHETEAIIAADKLCDDYGIDTISCGVAVGFAMECFEKGLITIDETGGANLSFGNGEALLEIVPQIANREGIGQILADGVRKASEKIEGSSDFAMHVKGLELPGYDPRGMKGQSLTYSLSDRGGCHLRSSTLRYELMPMPEPVDRFGYEGKAALIRELQLENALINCLIACAFGSFAVTPEDYAKALSALTGWNCSPEELQETAERVWNLARLINVREGFTRKDDTLPERLFAEASTTGPSKGQSIDRVSFEKMLDEYYDAMAWDRETGAPKEKKLEKLGIKKIA